MTDEATPLRPIDPLAHRALEALVRLTDEELKHQEMFRRIEGMVAAGMPAGYKFVAEPNAVASAWVGRPLRAIG